MSIWSLWWVWMVGALVLAILEVLAPAQIFLGFAIGAAGVGLALLVGIPGLSGSLPALLPRIGRHIDPVRPERHSCTQLDRQEW